MSGRKRLVLQIKPAWMLLVILPSIGCREPLPSVPSPQGEGSAESAMTAIEATLAKVVDEKADNPGAFGSADAVDQSDAIPESRLLAESLEADAETEEILSKYVGPDQRVRERLVPPPGARPVGRDNHLWINREVGHVIADGYVTMTRGVLEMFACPTGTKEHEAVVATLAKSKEVHAALLAIGAEPGTPVQFVPKFVPATGQVIRVWVCWRDPDGKFHTVDARQWISKMKSKQAMDAEWVFAGSGFWKDPADGREYYQADGGDMICVSNFSTAMLDISIASSAESDQLMFQPATEKIPERGTPVRLVLVPIPNPIDAKDNREARRWAEEFERKKSDPPSDQVLPPLNPAKSEEVESDKIERQ